MLAPAAPVFVAAAVAAVHEPVLVQAATVVEHSSQDPDPYASVVAVAVSPDVAPASAVVAPQRVHPALADALVLLLVRPAALAAGAAVAPHAAAPAEHAAARVVNQPVVSDQQRAAVAAVQPEQVLVTIAVQRLDPDLDARRGP